MNLRSTRHLVLALVLGSMLVACSGRDTGAPQNGGAGSPPANAETAPSDSDQAAENDTPGARPIQSNDGKFEVNYVVLPTGQVPLNTLFQLLVIVKPEGGAALGECTLSVDAAMPEHGHGMNVQPKVSALGQGRFSVEGLLFHMPGRWELYFDVTRNGVTSRAQDEITLE